MKYLAIISLILLFAGCAQPRYLQPAREQNSNTEILYHSGNPYIRSTMDNAEVSAQVMARGTRTLSLDLLCFNDGSEILDIVPADINVTGYSDLGIPYTFRVFSAEEYIRRRNTRNAIIGGVVVVATVATAFALADNAFTNGGNFNGDWFLWSLGAVPSVVMDSRAMAPAISDDGLARPHSLLPQSGYRGIVVIQGKPEYMHRIDMTVPVNGVPHRFSFSGKKQQGYY